MSCPIQPKPKIRTTPIIKIGEYLQKKPNTSRIKTIMDKKITQKSLSQHIDNENIKFLKWNLSPKDVIKKPTSTGKKLNVFVNSINNNQDSKGSKVLKAILSPKFLPNKKTFQLEKTLKNKNDYSKCPIKQIIRKKAISISDNYNNNKENQPMRMISEKNYFENSFKHKFCKK